MARRGEGGERLRDLDAVGQAFDKERAQNVPKPGLKRVK
jgi:hypothetical protein